MLEGLSAWWLVGGGAVLLALLMTFSLTVRAAIMYVTVYPLICLWVKLTPGRTDKFR